MKRKPHVFFFVCLFAFVSINEIVLFRLCTLEVRSTCLMFDEHLSGFLCSNRNLKEINSNVNTKLQLQLILVNFSLYFIYDVFKER